MTTVANDRIAKVQKLSKVGNFVVTAMLALACVGAPICLGIVAFTPDFPNSTFTTRLFLMDGALSVPLDKITTLGIKLALIGSISIVVAITIKVLLHLRALFQNLSMGDIYTQANVRHIRSIGWLSLAAAVLQLLATPIALLLVQAGVFDATLLADHPSDATTNSIDSFFTAGVILLSSWIMDIGRETSDAAEELRKDAELVV